MNAAVKIIAACQSVIARFLPPDGIREDFALQELVKILDGPEAVALTMQPASTVTQLQEAQAAMAARRGVVRSFTSGQGAVAQAPYEPSEVTIARLREELARKRQAENDLIADRDRLIHVNLANADAKIKEADAKIKGLRAQRDALEDEKEAALKSLQACEERERRLTERLASIAAQASYL